MKKISRRSFLIATGAIAAATVMTACSGGSTGKANTTASSAASAAPETVDPQQVRGHRAHHHYLVARFGVPVR